MLIKLPIPIYFNGEVYATDIEIKKPNAGCIADAKKISDSEDPYGAIAFFIASCTESLETVNGSVADKGIIKNAIRNMPYRSAEYVFIKIMLLRHSDDGVEGIYFCPRCRTQIICEAKKDKASGEIISDTRDFINQMPVNYTDGFATIRHELSDRIEIRTTDDRVLETIESFTMRHPTLADAISGMRRADKRDELRCQFGTYVESLLEINDQKIDSKWKNNYGMIMFDKADIENDLYEISRKVNEFGIEKRVDRTCPNCGKEWRSIINTSNFFDLEAQLM